MTRTFSKMFSMAGCRLGYVVGWAEGIKLLQKLCTPHNTNAFAMLFAEKIIESPEIIDSLIQKFNAGRKYLIEQLDKYGYAHHGEAGNFIFIKPKMNPEIIVKRMKQEKGILVKSYPTVGSLGDCLRVSIGEVQYMQRFITALVEIESEVDNS